MRGAMRADLERAIRLVRLLDANQRVRICRIAEELGVSKRSAYHWIENASLAGMPIRLEHGVVIRLRPEEPNATPPSKSAPGARLPRGAAIIPRPPGGSWLLRVKNP